MGFTSGSSTASDDLRDISGDQRTTRAGARKHPTTASESSEGDDAKEQDTGLNQSRTKLMQEQSLKLDDWGDLSLPRMSSKERTDWMLKQYGLKRGPYKSAEFRKALLRHPDRSYVHWICTTIDQGVPMGYTGPRRTRIAPQPKLNAEKTRIVMDRLQEEHKKGRIIYHGTQIPKDSKALQFYVTNPVYIIPKNKRPDCTKWRRIDDLSDETGGFSINDHINKDDFRLKFASFQAACRRLWQVGAGAWMFSRDLEDAYPQLLVDPYFWPLQGFRVWINNEWHFFTQTRCCFGGRCFPGIFERFSSAIHYIMISQGISFMLHLLDDFLYISPSTGERGKTECVRDMTIFDTTLTRLGPPANIAKGEGPTQLIRYLGIYLDSVNMICYMPEDKIKWGHDGVCDILSAGRATKKRWRSVVGRLQHISLCNRAGMTFMQRLYALLKQIQSPKIPDHHRIRMTAGARRDLAFWKDNMLSWNGVTSIPKDVRMTQTEINLFADASDFGGGAVFHLPGERRQRWIVHEWDVDDREKDIHWKEARMLTWALCTWGHLLAEGGYTFKLWTDNQSTATAARRMYCKSSLLGEEFRAMQMIAFRHNLDILIDWIPGVSNHFVGVMY